MTVTRPIRKAAGEWTYEDLVQLPEDGGRYEIIDGELYEMTAPNPDHAIVVANIFAMLLPLVKSLRGRVLTAPLDVFFPGANPVQPDVLVLLPDRLHLISKRGIEGAPDLVIEVLSPSNPEHDRVRKRDLYARGGVPEYWLVERDTASVEVLVLREGSYTRRVFAHGEELVTSTILPRLSFSASVAFE